MPFWTKKPGKQQSFSSVMRGLQYSVNAAMEMLEARNLELLGRYFTEDGHPHIRQLHMDEKTAINVPVISIVNPAAMNIQEVEMDFSVQVDATQLHQKEPQRGIMAEGKTQALKLDWESSDFEVSFNGKPDQSTMHVRLKFCSTPIPEGLARIIEECDKTIATVGK